jgi:AraC-like DNA-binding protein
MSSTHRQESVSRPNGLFSPQLLFVLDGEGTLTANDEVHVLRRGSAFYLADGVAHSYSGDGLITAWVTFDGYSVGSLKRQFGGGGIVIYQDADTAKYQKMISDMEREYFGNRREKVLSAMIYSLVMSFFAEDDISSMSDMDKVISYMEEHYADNITLEALCKISGMGHSSFSVRFKERFGVTAFEMLMEIRLANADMMLSLYPEQKVHSVARNCGFSDVGYFCKSYKKKYGRTPRDK